MQDWEQRTVLLLGEDKVEKLHHSSVLIVGVGGVGGISAEMLCRAGVGNITIIDKDIVAPSNINRQIIALQSNVYQPKVDVLEKRLLDINPQINVTKIADWLDENNTEEILENGKFSFVIDAIDTLSPKIFLIKTCIEKNIPIVSAMGAGAKKDITKVQITDISKTNYCPLAKAVRNRLSKLGIKKGLPVVYSTELPEKQSVIEIDEKYKKSTTGTISYMPAVFGLYLANYVIQKLTEENYTNKND